MNDEYDRIQAEMNAELFRLRDENQRLREGIEVARDFTIQGTINGEPATIKFCDTTAYLRATAVRSTST